MNIVFHEALERHRIRRHQLRDRVLPQVRVIGKVARKRQVGVVGFLPLPPPYLVVIKQFERRHVVGR